MTLTSYESSWVTEETLMFRKTVHRFIEKELAPRQARCDGQGRPGAEAGKAGLPLAEVPNEYGENFVHDAVVVEELARAGLHFGFQNIVRHKLGLPRRAARRSAS